MKKYILLGLLITSTSQTYSQRFEIEQLLLNVEKLNQFREILQQMYDGYKTLEQGYNKVRDIASGNFNLHQVFLDGLYLVNPEIKKYYKVPEIIDYQSRIIKEYKSTYKAFQTSGLFNSNQLNYFSKVYKKLFDESIQNIADLTDILTSGKARMSDEERLEAIDKIHQSTSEKMKFLKKFNSEHTLLAIEKLKDQAEQQTIKDLHGIK